MNKNYLWQAEQPLLQNGVDPKNIGADTLQPEAFFEKLLVPEDKFSYLVENYLEKEMGTTDGKTYGIQYEFIEPEEGGRVFMVWCVKKGSDAEKKGIKRGDIFTRLNGIDFSKDSNLELLYDSLREKKHATLNKAEVLNGKIVETGEIITVNRDYTETTPILEAKRIIHMGKKVGYLALSDFNFPASEFKTQMNDVFSIKLMDINELVLDLRYNEGGYIENAKLLAKIIGPVGSGDVFLKLFQGEKKQPFMDTFEENTSVSLKLNRLYVLTSSSTASASEAIINGLKPYMQVVVIGEKTIGKDLFSLKLYDSTDFNPEDINPNHKYAIQPIVGKYVNKNGDSVSEGITPDYTTKKIKNTLLQGNLPPLGDPSEELLNKALSLITAN